MRRYWTIAAVLVSLTACSGAAGGGGGASFGEADPSLTAANPGNGPLNPFLANGNAVLKAFDAVEAKSGSPLRVTSMNADTMNGLTIDVQEPKNHVNVDQYVIAPNGNITGPAPVKLSMLGGGGGPPTAKDVDRAAFDPRSIPFANLSQAVRDAIKKSTYSDARIANWEIDGIGPDDRRYLYLDASRGRPAAAISPKLTVVRMSY